MPRTGRITSFIVSALAVTAFVAPAASARPSESANPSPVTYTTAPSVVRVPNGEVTARVFPRRVVPESSDSRFNWGDAGIGAGAMLALGAIAVGAAVALSDRRRREQRQTASA